jgi:hypothetical protein
MAGSARRSRLYDPVRDVISREVGAARQRACASEGVRDWMTSLPLDARCKALACDEGKVVRAVWKVNSNLSLTDALLKRQVPEAADVRLLEAIDIGESRRTLREGRRPELLVLAEIGESVATLCVKPTVVMEGDVLDLLDRCVKDGFLNRTALLDDAEFQRLVTCRLEAGQVRSWGGLQDAVCAVLEQMVLRAHAEATAVPADLVDSLLELTAQDCPSQSSAKRKKRRAHARRKVASDADTVTQPSVLAAGEHEVSSAEAKHAPAETLAADEEVASLAEEDQVCGLDDSWVLVSKDARARRRQRRKRAAPVPRAAKALRVAPVPRRRSAFRSDAVRLCRWVDGERFVWRVRGEVRRGGDEQVLCGYSSDSGAVVARALHDRQSESGISRRMAGLVAESMCPPQRSRAHSVQESVVEALPDDSLPLLATLPHDPCKWVVLDRDDPLLLVEPCPVRLGAGCVEEEEPSNRRDQDDEEEEEAEDADDEDKLPEAVAEPSPAELPFLAPPAASHAEALPWAPQPLWMARPVVQSWLPSPPPPGWAHSWGQQHALLYHVAPPPDHASRDAAWMLSSMSTGADAPAMLGNVAFVTQQGKDDVVVSLAALEAVQRQMHGPA